MLKIGELKEVKVMLLDNDGNPTAGTITYTVYDENDVSFDVGTMSTVSGVTGLYTMSFTPDAAGAWSVLFTCSSPNRTAVKVFDVGVGVEQASYNAIVVLSSALTVHDAAIKALLATVQADLDNPNQYKANVSPLALEATLTAIKGSGWSTETLKAIKDAVDAIAGGGTPPADVWNYVTRTLTDPDSYKADVSSLALEASLATHNANMEALINALNDLSTSDVWGYGSRTLTDPNSYKADISALALEATLATHDTDIKTLLATIQADLDSPNQYKADVSALALEATLTAIKGGGWTNETLKAIKDAIDALTDASASDVWNNPTRTLTDPNSYKADISALALEATLATHDVDIKALLTTVQTDLDNPSQYKADVSALALEASLGTHDTDIKTLLATIGGYLDTEIADIKTETDKIPTLLTETQSHPTLAEMEASTVLALKAHLVHGTGDIIPPDNKGIWDYLPYLNANIDSRAPASEYDTEMARITANVATEAKQDVIDGIVDDILADTATINWGDITTLDTLIDGIVADIGVFPTANYATLAAYVEDIRTRLIAIVGDTNELQIDWVDGGRLDLLIDAIKAKTDNLPASPAPANEYDTEMARITADVATEAKQDIINSLVDDIFKGVTPISKQVANDANNSQWQFKTTLTETVNNYFNDMYVIFISGIGSVKYQTRKIVGYDSDNKIIRVDRPFTTIPPDNEWFFILPRFSSSVDIEDEFGWDEFLGSSPSKRYTTKETEGGITNDAVAVAGGELQLTGEATVGGVKGSVWIRTRKPLLKFPLNKKVIVDVKQKTSTAPSANDYSNLFLILKEPNGNHRPHDWEDGILIEVARYTGDWKWMLFQKTAGGSWTNLYDSGVKSGADEDDGTWRIIFNDDDGKDRVLLKLKADKCFSEVWSGNFNLDWEENEGYIAYELDTLTTDNKTIITYYCKTTVIDKSLSPATLVTDGTIITDGSNTSSTFKTDLVDTNNDFYNGLIIVFKSGSNMGQARKISDYDGTTHFVTVAKALQAEPAADDLFTIVPIWTEPASPATEAKQDTIDTVVDAIKVETDQLPNWRFEDKLPTTPTVDAVASASETSLTAGSVTPTFPTGATRQRAYVVATLHVANKSAATHKIGLTLQKQKDAEGYGDVVDLTANPPISLVNVDGATATFAIVCDVTALVDASGSTYYFKWLVDSDNAGAVNYCSNFVLVIIYSM